MLRLIGWLFGFGVFLAIGALAVAGVYLAQVSAQLPDYKTLQHYQPPVTTRVHAADGTLLAEFAQQRRLFQPISTIPKLVIHAFLSAEDKDFYSHGGIDFFGVIRAIRDNVMAKVEGEGGPLVGASTITQQVAKNILLSSEQTWDRKIQEALLALRIESTFSKDKILELYLNEIFLGTVGGQTYGVAAAALNYFDKPLSKLTLSEAAYLAALPKAPANYHPYRQPEAAKERRDWVIDRIVENGYATFEEGEAAKAQPLDVHPRGANEGTYAAEYFTEEVRRQLKADYGEAALYGGGLSVRTTLDTTLQGYARKALMDGLIEYDRKTGFRQPVATIDPSGDWGETVFDIKPLGDVPEWKLAVVLGVDGNQAQIGIRPDAGVTGGPREERVTGTLAGPDVKWVNKKLSSILQVGDVIYVSKLPKTDDRYTLEQVPDLQGALVAMDPRTGRVLAMVGGFSFAQSEFNRATQALRQPGSSFKPIVYSAALDSGYTPASVVLDAPIEIANGDGSYYRPQNYGQTFYGPQTLRVGIEKSRNVMTVRLGQDLGLPLIVDYAEMFGVYDKVDPRRLGPSLPLGVLETTVMRMTAAYATIANGGRKIDPTLIDRIQDATGHTIWRHDSDVRICDGCNATSWTNQPEPLIIDNRPQVLDPMTAYQITEMMEGVVQRGTGTAAKVLNRPVAGKTGTSQDYGDAWFIGFTPELTVGIWFGFDSSSRKMRREGTGGELVVPVFADFVGKALKGKPPVPFNVPAGMTQVWIDPASGVKAAAGQRAIYEAFKPGTGPNLVTSVIGIDSNAFEQIQNQAQGDDTGFDVTIGRGGLF